MRVTVCGNADCVRLLCRRSAAWQLHRHKAPIYMTIYVATQQDDFSNLSTAAQFFKLKLSSTT